MICRWCTAAGLMILPRIVRVTRSMRIPVRVPSPVALLRGLVDGSLRLLASLTRLCGRRARRGGGLYPLTGRPRHCRSRIRRWMGSLNRRRTAPVRIAVARVIPRRPSPRMSLVRVVSRCRGGLLAISCLGLLTLRPLTLWLRRSALVALIVAVRLIPLARLVVLVLVLLVALTLTLGLGPRPRLSLTMRRT